MNRNTNPDKVQVLFLIFMLWMGVAALIQSLFVESPPHPSISEAIQTAQSLNPNLP